MPEPITTGSGGVLAVSAGVTAATLLTGIDAGTAIGAFAGAVVFVLSAQDFPLFRRLACFVVSFAVGLYASKLAAAVLTAMLTGAVSALMLERVSIKVDCPVGATFAAAAAIRVLMMVSAKPKSGGSIFDRFGGGDK